MQCYRVAYYFRQGSKRSLLKGYYCGCITGIDRKAAIASISPVEVSDGCTLAKVTATRKPKGHICTKEED